MGRELKCWLEREGLWAGTGAAGKGFPGARNGGHVMARSWGEGETRGGTGGMEKSPVLVLPALLESQVDLEPAQSEQSWYTRA